MEINLQKSLEHSGTSSLRRTHYLSENINDCRDERNLLVSISQTVCKHVQYTHFIVATIRRQLF